MSDQTQATLSAPSQPADDVAISAADRAVLRRLASQVAELAARPIEAEKRELWYRHNALEATRPLIFCDPENGWDEIITAADLVCAGELARGWEMRLRKEIFWGAQMGDDRVIEPSFNVRHVYTESDWGMHETRIGGGHGDAYRWEAPLKSYADLDRLRFPQIVVDEEATARMIALANDTLGDILPVRLKTSWWWTLGMTWTLVNLRGLAQIMYDMVDQPEALHRTMAFLRDGHLAKLDFLEQQRAAEPEQRRHLRRLGRLRLDARAAAAGFRDRGRVRPIDMWGFGESQETVGVSPAMFAEFIFPYQLPILERFGLNCYGCCEPLDKRWHIVQRIPRLRRVSVSAWANLPRMAEMLGDRYIFSLKPAPADLAMDSFDEDAIRARLREGFRITRGCRVEAIMKDNHTIRNDPSRVIRWVRIAREEAERL